MTWGHGPSHDPHDGAGWVLVPNWFARDRVRKLGLFTLATQFGLACFYTGQAVTQDRVPYFVLAAWSLTSVSLLAWGTWRRTWLPLKRGAWFGIAAWFGVFIALLWPSWVDFVSLPVHVTVAMVFLAGATEEQTRFLYQVAAIELAVQPDADP